MAKDNKKGLLIVDKNFTIVSSNEAFRKVYSQVENGQVCYKALYGFNSPCPHCRIVSKDFSTNALLNPNNGIWNHSEIEKLDIRVIGECYSIEIEDDNDLGKVGNENKTKDEIREATDLWNTALNNMPNGYHRCDTDEELTLIDVSDRFCELIGFSREEIKEKFNNKFINLVCKDDLPKFKNYVNEINNKVNHYYAQFVYRIKSAKGYIWVIDSTKYVKSGDYSFFQGTITDVTNIVDVHQKDKENLLNSETKINQYKKALVSGADVIYEVNVTQNMLEVGSFYKDEEEYSISSITDLTIPCKYTDYLPYTTERVTEEDREIYYETNTLEYFKRCFEQGVLKWQLEYDTLSFSMKHTHLRKHYILTQNELTGDIHALIVSKDLTEEEKARKESEYNLKVQKRELSNALTKAEQRLKVIDGLCNEYHIVFYVDVLKDSFIPYVLPDEEGKLYPIGEVQETPFSKLIKHHITHNTDKKEQEELLRKTKMDVVLQSLSDKETYQVNYKTKKGKNVEHSQLRIVSIDNNKYEQVWAFRSIEHIVQEERKQQKILQDLLTKSQKAEKAKTTFLLNMSHDIRTPMNAIIGFNSIAKNSLDNKEEALNALNKTDIASHHLLNLINEVLEMARIENKKLQLHNQVINCKEVFEQIKAMFSVGMEQHNINFVTKYDISIPYVYLDVTRVIQVATNLLGNALKFTKSGGKISYETREIEKNKDTVLFEVRVKDSGIGMSKEFQKKLFDAFEREENPTTSPVVGTGLGLSISKNIAHLLGGDLTCVSEQGKGSEFTFTFKAKIADKEKAEQNRAKESISLDIDKNQFSNLRLLIVEDNDLNLEIAIKVLTRYGFIVESARDGSEAVEIVKSKPAYYFDLVLMDIQMPVMDGYTATTKIRELDDKEKGSVPIVAMTANAFEEDKKKALEVGMNGHLSKPINISKLLEIIQKYTDKDKSSYTEGR